MGRVFQDHSTQTAQWAEPVIRLFRDFVDSLPFARTAREKVLTIDRLIHGFHWYYKTNSPTRPVAINLIEGRLRQVISFLDDLTYSDQSTPGTRTSKRLGGGTATRKSNARLTTR